MTDWKAKAEGYRKCYEESQNTFKSERIIYQATAAQLEIALRALKDVDESRGWFQCALRRLIARNALAKINDPTKSPLDWANEYPDRFRVET